jgi:hypothetical protein
MRFTRMKGKILSMSLELAIRKVAETLYDECSVWTKGRSQCTSATKLVDMARYAPCIGCGLQLIFHRWQLRDRDDLGAILEKVEMRKKYQLDTGRASLGCCNDAMYMLKNRGSRDNEFGDAAHYWALQEPSHTTSRRLSFHTHTHTHTIFWPLLCVHRWQCLLVSGHSRRTAYDWLRTLRRYRSIR